MEKVSINSKKEETYKLIDQLFPEINEISLENTEDIFAEKELLEDTYQYINFQVGKEFYAVEITNVLEIVKVPRISFLPSASHNIMGLINLRGNIIPIVNTHNLFGIQTVHELDKSAIIIINIDKSNVGFLVDSVSQVIELRKEDIDKPMVTLEVEKTEYIIGESNIDGQLVGILDICKLVRNEIFVKETASSNY